MVLTEPVGPRSSARAHNVGYVRSRFRLWTDGDRDGCNTRYEVLIMEAKTKPRVRSGCTLSGGRWTSPYDGKAYTDPSKLDIDHLVPLAEAWASGAYGWTAATHTAYANDLGYGRSLVAVTAALNRSKGSDEPNGWLPSKCQCSYVWQWQGGVGIGSRQVSARPAAVTFALGTHS